MRRGETSERMIARKRLVGKVRRVYAYARYNFWCVGTDIQWHEALLAMSDEEANLVAMVEATN